MVRTWRFHPGMIPGWGTKILQATRCTSFRQSSTSKQMLTYDEQFYLLRLTLINVYHIPRNHSKSLEENYVKVPKALCFYIFPPRLEEYQNSLVFLYPARYHKVLVFVVSLVFISLTLPCLSVDVLVNACSVHIEMMFFVSFFGLLIR